MISKEFKNILIMGFGFMLIYSANQTMESIEKTFLESVKIDDPSFDGEAYNYMGVSYVFYSCWNWVGPSINVYTGPRGAIVLGAMIYWLYMLTFLWPRSWLLYTASIIVGLGSAMLWTGQGSFLARCSTSVTISRNSGIFWGLYQTNMFFGNLIIFFLFKDVYIKEKTRQLVILILASFGIIGNILLACLQPVYDNSDHANKKNGVIAFVSAINLIRHIDMFFLILPMAYTGFELAFYSGIYGSSIGFTLQISESPKEIVGLSGICMGLGEMLSAVLIGLIGSKLPNIKRSSIVGIGYLAHIIAYISIGINLPNNAPFENTNDISLLNPPQIWLALLCAFLLGVGDACFNTQIYALLSIVFVKNSAGAFALLNFLESSSAAICYLCASSIGLIVQLEILILMATVGAGCFCFEELCRPKSLEIVPEE